MTPQKPVWCSLALIARSTAQLSTLICRYATTLNTKSVQKNGVCNRIPWDSGKQYPCATGYNLVEMLPCVQVQKKPFLFAKKLVRRNRAVTCSAARRRATASWSCWARRWNSSSCSVLWGTSIVRSRNARGLAFPIAKGLWGKEEFGKLQNQLVWGWHVKTN